MAKVTDRQQKCRQMLQNLGLSLSGACALVGNFVQESGPDLPSAFRTGRLDHGSQGLPQWRLERLQNYQRFVRNGRGPSVLKDPKELWAFYGNMGLQMDYVVEELRVDYPKLYEKLKRGGDVAALTADVCWQYERPNRALSGIANRIDHAKALLAATPLNPHARPGDPLAQRAIEGVSVVDHLQAESDTHQTQATGAAAGGLILASFTGAGALASSTHTVPDWAWILVAVVAAGVVACGIVAAVEGRRARNVRQAIGNVTPDAPPAAEVEHATVPDAAESAKAKEPTEDERIRAGVRQALQDMGLIGPEVQVGKVQMPEPSKVLPSTPLPDPNATGIIPPAAEQAQGLAKQEADPPVFTILNRDGTVREQK